MVVLAVVPEPWSMAWFTLGIPGRNAGIDASMREPYRSLKHKLTPCCLKVFLIYMLVPVVCFVRFVSISSQNKIAVLGDVCLFKVSVTCNPHVRSHSER